MKTSINILILLMIFINSVNAQQDKDKIFEKLKKQYAELQTISLNFTLNENTFIKGQLNAKKGNKYILSFGNKIIYCNNKIIWNYSPTNNSVIISNYDDSNESISIEKIFFQFTEDFKAEKLYKNQISNNESSTILELIPKNSNQSDISKIKISINTNNLNISNVVIVSNYNEESWKISNLKLNTNIDDNRFDFKVPENVEIIDLR